MDRPCPPLDERTAHAAARRPSRFLGYLVFIPPILVHLALLAAFEVEVTLASVIVFFVAMLVMGLGITIGFHRYFSHRSFNTSRVFQFLLGFAGCTALQKGPLWWVTHHRLHHIHSDTERDPHSPIAESFWYAHMGWLFSTVFARPNENRVRDIARFPEIVWLERLWTVPGVLAASACYSLGGWAWVIYGYCLSTAVTYQLTFAINSLGHSWGSQRFATGEGSRNNPLLGVLAMGEGWHNNHHRAPTSARHGFAWYEFDLSYAVIRLLQSVGIVWAVRQPPAAAMAVARGIHKTET